MVNKECDYTIHYYKPSMEDPVNILKVLLVDDYERFRRSLASFLTKQRGVQVIGEAANGGEAIAETERLQPDLVLMDLEMPDPGGTEAMREIKMRVPRTRVVILSPYGREIYRRMGG